LARSSCAPFARSPLADDSGAAIRVGLLIRAIVQFDGDSVRPSERALHVMSERRQTHGVRCIRREPIEPVERSQQMRAVCTDSLRPPRLVRAGSAAIPIARHPCVPNVVMGLLGAAAARPLERTIPRPVEIQKTLRAVSRAIRSPSELLVRQHAAAVRHLV
jgi:hypothetical protein